MARYADKHHQDIQLNGGNLVYISTEHFPLAHYLSHKLAPHWVGPIPISGIISGVACHINLLEEYRHIQPIFYLSYLHPKVGLVPTRSLPPPPLNNDTAGEFKVENILDSHLGRYGTKYLIKWLVYPVFEAMWEPDAHVAYAPDILHSFLSCQERQSFH